MTYNATINKALIVLDPSTVQSGTEKDSTLLQRAVSLAQATGCAIELFHVSYDASLDSSLITSEEELQQARERLTDTNATRLAELALRLKGKNVAASHETRWGHPRTEVILQKIAQSKPDVVMKQAREKSYILGLSSHADWELARRSPAHVWFVNEDVKSINKVLAAIGNKHGDSDDITTATDYELLRTAGLIGKSFDATVYSVNAYQIPSTPIFTAGVAQAVVATAKEQSRLREKITKQHSGAVKALAKRFSIPNDNVHIREGHPNHVIPTVTEEVDADLLLLGAKSIGRLERLLGSVTVEPVMAETNCDIVVTRERDLSVVPDIKAEPLHGKPQYNVEQAIIDPEGTFNSPKEAALATDLSLGLRRRILAAWESDVRAVMNAENEGSPVQDSDAETLRAICAANELLDAEAAAPRQQPLELGGISA